MNRIRETIQDGRFRLLVSMNDLRSSNRELANKYNIRIYLKIFHLNYIYLMSSIFIEM
jgi:hypothetical protein